MNGFRSLRELFDELQVNLLRDFGVLIALQANAQQFRQIFRLIISRFPLTSVLENKFIYVHSHIRERHFFELGRR